GHRGLDRGASHSRISRVRSLVRGRDADSRRAQDLSGWQGPHDASPEHTHRRAAPHGPRRLSVGGRAHRERCRRGALAGFLEHAPLAPSLGPRSLLVRHPSGARAGALESGPARARLTQELSMNPDLSPLILDLAKKLVDRPDDVRVQVRDGDIVLYELSVAPEDQGRIIGREGRTIRSLRSVVQTAARKQGFRATLEVLE